ncbi:MAG TPA: hypothetical protein VGM88_25860 [Kofleriaceae bacterium]|jgi:4'-phosphopantetheinyl transferase EntD
MFAIVERAVGADRHGADAAREAIARIAPDATLGYDGTRPIVVGAPGVAVSITHSRTRAVAVAARVARLGIDLVDDADAARCERLAPRYLARELAFARTPLDLARCLAAKEAGLKALGLGLLDGGMFDACAVSILSLEPPRLATSSHPLSLWFAARTLAIAFG